MIKILLLIIISSISFGVLLYSFEQVPSSSRSQAAVSKVEPTLKEDLSKSGLNLGSPIFIRIFKTPAILELWIQKDKEYVLFKKYPILKFSGSLGPKTKEGDMQAPEGCYFVKPQQMNPNSTFHLSFNLGYPNKYDQFHGYTGSALMVHGSSVSIGCYAMGDSAIEEIWTMCIRALEKGQPFFRVHCFPFPLTDDNLTLHKDDKWISFWKNLKVVYDNFESSRVPPDISVDGAGNYILRPTSNKLQKQ